MGNGVKVSGVRMVLHLNGNTWVFVNLIYLRKVSSYNVFGKISSGRQIIREFNL